MPSFRFVYISLCIPINYNISAGEFYEALSNHHLVYLDWLTTRPTPKEHGTRLKPLADLPSRICFSTTPDVDILQA